MFHNHAFAMGYVLSRSGDQRLFETRHACTLIVCGTTDEDGTSSLPREEACVGVWHRRHGKKSMLRETTTLPAAFRPLR
jgi:hypothetical protein